MPSFSDSIVLFILALLLFGPKKLPVLARELGKWLGEFRRASNEFKMQMEEELRVSEQEERQKQVAAMEAAAPQVALPEPEHPQSPIVSASSEAEEPPSTPLPIASSGDLNMMPPATGLPMARGKSESPNETDKPQSEHLPEDTAHEAVSHAG